MPTSRSDDATSQEAELKSDDGAAPANVEVSLRLVATLTGHTEAITDINFSKAGDRVHFIAPHALRRNQLATNP